MCIIGLSYGCQYRILFASIVKLGNIDKIFMIISSINTNIACFISF